MKYTAKEFKQGKTQEAYNKAYKGEKVEINHDRYKDVVFVLSARKREPLRPPLTEGGE